LTKNECLDLCEKWFTENKMQFAEIVSKSIIPPITEDQTEIARISIQVSQVMLMRIVPLLISEVVAAHQHSAESLPENN